MLHIKQLKSKALMNKYKESRKTIRFSHCKYLSNHYNIITFSDRHCISRWSTEIHAPFTSTPQIEHCKGSCLDRV